MLTKITILTTLLLPLFTSASPFPYSLFQRQTKVLPGSCPDTNQPLEFQFIIGYNQFCSTYLAPGDDRHLIKYGVPLVATFDLGTPSGQTAKWVFKIEQGETSNTMELVPVDEATCKEQFRKFLETDDAGGLGKAYCVVDGTGGDKNGKDEMAGQGIVSVLGGKTSTTKEGNSNYWRLDFVSYRREG